MSTLWTILLICLSILCGLSDSYYNHNHGGKVFRTKSQTVISEQNGDFIGNGSNSRSLKYQGTCQM